MRHIAFLFVVALALAPRDLSALDKAKDYVCGKEIAVGDKTLCVEEKGVPFYFCSEEHVKAFQADPAKFFQAASDDSAWWVGQVCTHYFEVRKALAADSLDGIAGQAKSAGEFASVASKLAPKLDEAVLTSYREELDGIAKASAFPEKLDLESARSAFKTLSQHVVLYVRKVASKQQPAPAVFLFHCGMAHACWAQEAEAAGNPYFGKAMPSCGEPVPAVDDDKFDPTDGCKEGEDGGCKGGC